MEKPVKLINSGMLRDLWAPSKQGAWCRRKGPNSLAVSNNVPSSSLMLNSPSLPLCHYRHQLPIGKWREPRDFQMPYKMGQYSTGHPPRTQSPP